MPWFYLTADQARAAREAITFEAGEMMDAGPLPAVYEKARLALSAPVPVPLLLRAAERAAGDLEAEAAAGEPTEGEMRNPITDAHGRHAAQLRAAVRKVKR